MDKTIEIVMVATVILLTALTVMFMLSDQSEGFDNWMNNTQGDAECSLKQTQFENACNCPPGGTQEEAQAVKDNAPDSCELDDLECSEVC